MKKPLLLALLALSLAGCSKNSRDPAPAAPAPATKPQLEGTWQRTTFHSIERTPTGQIIYEETSTIPAGTGIIEISATALTLLPSIGDSQRRSYTRNGDVLSFAFDDDLTIKELTETKLVLVSVSTVADPPNLVTNTSTYQRK